jgi:hypothetical protein
MKRALITSLVAMAAAMPSLAQTIAGVGVEPAVAQVGDAVKITATFDDAAAPNCNVRLHFGDGTTRDFKINQAKDVPLVTSHTYKKAGDYTVKVEGKTALPMLKCVGANKTAPVKVAAPPPPPAPAPAASAAAAARPAGPACPAGWTLNTASVNKKSGAFTCTAKAGTALPAARLACPGALGYFENQAKGQLGCRP